MIPGSYLRARAFGPLADRHRSAMAFVSGIIVLVKGMPPVIPYLLAP